MNRNGRRSPRLLVLALVLLAAGALVGFWVFGIAPDRMEPRRTSQRPGEFSSNGERIYFTGTSDRTGRIPRVGGPHWVQIHQIGCADCHGPEGRGGRPVVHVSPTPPDIRWSTLMGAGNHEHEGEQDNGHPGYTTASLTRAIREGISPGGDRLSGDMPRWQMDERDMEDLLEYLQTLGRSPEDTGTVSTIRPGIRARGTGRGSGAQRPAACRATQIAQAIGRTDCGDS